MFLGLARFVMVMIVTMVMIVIVAMTMVMRVVVMPMLVVMIMIMMIVFSGDLLAAGAPLICPLQSGPETMIVWTTKGRQMPFKKHKPEEIIGKLREVEIVLAQGASTAEACRRIGVSEQTYYRWRKEYGGLKTDQARRMKDLEKENQRLRRAISDLTLDKLILQEAAKGNF